MGVSNQSSQINIHVCVFGSESILFVLQTLILTDLVNYTEIELGIDIFANTG